MADAFRVIKTTTNDLGKKTETTVDVIWEGTSISELSERFPRSDVMGADELGHHEIEDGWIRWDHHFERRSLDGVWQKIDDPRHNVRNPEHAALEAAIDEENRRLFPGDYDNERDEPEPYIDEEDD